jgi:SAM-dependent methyltransferase
MSLAGGEAERYDRIGATYTVTRQPDPRIASAILAALGDARSVVNVGAGTGSYEPADRTVIAVEPSAAMIARRPPSAAPVRQGHAESLPLETGSVDAAMAISTLHHWSDVRAGLRELRRVVRSRVVILVWDTSYEGSFWLTNTYIPELERWTLAHVPSLAEIEQELGPLTRRPIPIPRDCSDGFLRAFWARPEAYLDVGVRRNISQFNLVSEDAIDAGLERLRDDLESGVWDDRFGRLRRLEELDLGYCLLVASLES